MVLTDEEIAAKAPRAHLDAAVYEVGKLGPYHSGDYIKWTEDTLKTPHSNVENYVSLSADKTRVTIHKSGVYRITVRLEVGKDDDPREFILKPIAEVETAKYATDANKSVTLESFFDNGINAVQDSEIFNLDPGTELTLQRGPGRPNDSRATRERRVSSRGPVPGTRARRSSRRPPA